MLANEVSQLQAALDQLAGSADAVAAELQLRRFAPHLRAISSSLLAEMDLAVAGALPARTPAAPKKVVVAPKPVQKLPTPKAQVKALPPVAVSQAKVLPKPTEQPQLPAPAQVVRKLAPTGLIQAKRIDGPRRNPLFPANTRKVLAIATTSLALCAALITQAITNITPKEQPGTVAGVSIEQPALPQATSLPQPTDFSTTTWQVLPVTNLGVTVSAPTAGVAIQSSDGNTFTLTDSNGMLFRVNRIQLDPTTNLSSWLRKVERDNRDYRFTGGTLAGLSGRIGQPVASTGNDGTLYLLFQTDGKTSTYFYQVWVRQPNDGDAVGQEVRNRLLTGFTITQ